MVCSANLMAIDLAKDLQVHPETCAPVISMKSITSNEKSAIVANGLFHMGIAGILLAIKNQSTGDSSIRTASVSPVLTQMEDPNGNVGVAQFRDLMAVVGDALKTNIMTLGSFVLHISEQLLFFANLTRKTALKMKMKMKLKPYIPEFELAFEHFCILAGGRWCSMNWRRAFSCWSVKWSSQGWLCTGLETSFGALCGKN